MKKSMMSGAMLLAFALAGTAGFTQTVSPVPAEQKPTAKAAAPESSATPAHKLTDKQKALADEADKLLTLATELKEQVDRTNKNILSVKVVEKAEEIEQYAHRIKDQAKK